MNLVPDNALEAWHLAEAVDRWRPVARAAGMPVPPSLLAWAEACRMRARKCPEGTALASLSGAVASLPVMRLLLPLPDVAAALGVSERTAKRLMARGDLPSVLVERRRLVHVEDLAGYADSLRRPGPASTSPPTAHGPSENGPEGGRGVTPSPLSPPAPSPPTHRSGAIAS